MKSSSANPLQRMTGSRATPACVQPPDVGFEAKTEILAPQNDVTLGSNSGH